MTPFGVLVENNRTARDLTKNQLARLADLSPSYVTILTSANPSKAGQARKPSRTTVLALADALQLDGAARTQFLEAGGVAEPEMGVPSRKQPAMLKNVRSSGIVAVHDQRVPDRTRQWIQRAKKTIRIKDTWFAVTGYEDILLDAATTRGVLIQILLLNPKTHQARQRSQDIQPPNNHYPYGSGYVPGNISRNIREFEKMYRLGAKIELRLYPSLPSIQLLSCDDRTLMGFFAHGEVGDFSPQFEIENKNTPLGEFIDKEWNYLWNLKETKRVLPPPPNSKHTEVAISEDESAD